MSAARSGVIRIADLREPVLTDVQRMAVEAVVGAKVREIRLAPRLVENRVLRQVRERFSFYFERFAIRAE